MIYLTPHYSLSLSIKKTATLLHNLVELRDESGVDLPNSISESVDNLLLAQQALVDEIDNFLHFPGHYDNDRDFGMIATIVAKFPQFLASEDSRGRLPCHAAAHMTSMSLYASRYFHLFASIGCKYSIGGEDYRGGMLIPDFANDYTALHYITDPCVFHELENLNSPPLFETQDVENFNLLHNAVEHYSIDLVKYFCSLEPSCLYQRDNTDALPIHYVILRDERDDNLEMLQFLLQQSVSFDASNETIGGLFTKIPSDRGTLVLDALVERWGGEDVWDCIESALSTNRNIDKLPILHQTIRHAPRYLAEVINRFPESVHVCDRNNKNRLPVHVALETGMKVSLELTCLVAVSQEHLRNVDPVTKWPPFVLAAVGTSCDLITIYRLLQKYPEQVEMRCGGSGYKYIHPGENRKRRKMNR